jgi:transcriptional regulator with XRE-family HTH domain
MVASKKILHASGKDLKSKEIGARIKAMIKGRGASQRDLADHVGVSHGTISNWCAGKGCPNSMQLRDIAEFLGVNKDWLNSGQGDKFPRDSEDGITTSDNGLIVGDVLHDIIHGRLNLSLDDAACRLEMEPGELASQLGTDFTPSWRLLKKLHINLGVSIHFLLTGRGTDVLPKDWLDKLILVLGLRDDHALADALGVDIKEIKEIRAKEWAIPAAWHALLMDKFAMNPAWLMDGTYPSHLGVKKQGAPMAAEQALDYREKYLDTREALQDKNAELLAIKESITRAVANICAYKGASPDFVGMLNAAVIDYPRWQTPSQVKKSAALYEIEPENKKSHQAAVGD